jgi:hypothetical protein
MSDATQGPPDDVEALTAEIERTREELGETVEALAAKADVKARAKDAADQARKSVASTAGQVKAKVTGQAGELRSKVAGQGGKLASQAGGAVSQATPSQVREAAGRVPGSGRQRGLVAAAVAGVLAAVWLILRRRR